MYLFPSLVLGKGPTKSRHIRSNSLSTVIDFKRPDGFQDDGFRVWHFWLDNTWCVSCWVMLVQMKRLVSLCNVFVIPRCPAISSSWKACNAMFLYCLGRQSRKDFLPLESDTSNNRPLDIWKCWVNRCSLSGWFCFCKAKIILFQLVFSICVCNSNLFSILGRKHRRRSCSCSGWPTGFLEKSLVWPSLNGYKYYKIFGVTCFSTGYKGQEINDTLLKKYIRFTCLEVHEIMFQINFFKALPIQLSKKLVPLDSPRNFLIWVAEKRALDYCSKSTRPPSVQFGCDCSRARRFKRVLQMNLLHALCMTIRFSFDKRTTRINAKIVDTNTQLTVSKANNITSESAFLNAWVAESYVSNCEQLRVELFTFPNFCN